MRISYIQNKTELQSTETRISYNLIQNILGRGHEIVLNDCDDSCDVILSMNGLSQSPLFNKISSAYPNIKTVMYVWDCYPWTEYFKGYTELNSYTEIWTPSNEVILRLKEAYGVDESKCRVIKAYTTFFDSEPNKIRNDKFVYHFARPYNDPNFGITNKACQHLNIPLVRGNHSFTEEKYRDTILSCSFLVTEYMEASTGGLTLLEGYYHGKNVLVSDSIYMGAKDYFGDRAYYFKDGDINDFARMIHYLWNLEYTPDLEERREWCKQYTIDAMVDRILNRLGELV
jgi:glycosyltransferase involved in cell wall biosynthesis